MNALVQLANEWAADFCGMERSLARALELGDPFLDATCRRWRAEIAEYGEEGSDEREVAALISAHGRTPDTYRTDAMRDAIGGAASALRRLESKLTEAESYLHHGGPRPSQ